MRNFVLLLTWAIFFLGDGSASFAESILFERLSTDQGLSQASILSIVEDSKGFLWFGSQDGLNKFDGYTFKVYRNIPNDPTSLGSNYVQTIIDDGLGFLWVGTSNGLYQFDIKTEVFTGYHHKANDPHSLSNSKIWDIAKDPTGDLWVATDNGLNRFQRQTKQFIRYQIDNSDLCGNALRSLCMDSTDNLWIGTKGNGLCKFDTKSESFFTYKNHPEDPHSLSSNSVYSIAEDSQGYIWLGTNRGLNRYDKNTQSITRFLHRPDDPHSLPNYNIKVILPSGGDELWVGTAGGGLSRFDIKSQTFSNNQHKPEDQRSLSNNLVTAIFKDSSGLLWVGTNGGGLNKFDFHTQVFAHFQSDPGNSQSLSDDTVYAILKDSQGILWFGAQSGGLKRYNPSDQTFYSYLHQPNSINSLSKNFILAITEDRQGNLWIATWGGGLNRFNRKTGMFTRFQHQANDPKSLCSNELMALRWDSYGALWIGTHGGGLCRFNKDSETFARYRNRPNDPTSLSLNSIRSLYEDRQKTLWIGAWDGGLHKYDRSTDSFVRYQHNPNDRYSISNNNIMSIFEDQQGNFWIGTSGGLNRLDRQTQRFFSYREKDGLANDVISGILEDQQGFLWMSTNQGLSRFDPKTESISNFDQADGLLSNEFNTGAYYKDRSGRMYFGGVHGVSTFIPEQVRENTIPPRVVMTDFRLFNEPVEVAKHDNSQKGFLLSQQIAFTEAITLDYTDYIFTFEFSALNYRQSHKNQYAYMLEGFDKDWVVTDYRNRRATYTDLSHGDYVFRVKASNDDGYWNNEGTSVRLTILPPPWKTWWAKSLYILAGLGVIWMFVQSQRKKVKQKQLELDREKQFSTRLEQKVQERTKELRESLIKLKRAQRLLSEASHQAGMAEVAKSVLHNIGNVLNSIIISSNCVEDILTNLKVPKLKQTFMLLAEHKDDLAGFFERDNRASNVLPYLEMLVDHFIVTQTNALKDVQRLRHNADRISSIVAAQQDYANANGIKDTVSLASLIDQALEMSSLPWDQHQIDVVKNYADLPDIEVEIRSVLLILVNFINNAEYALMNSKNDKRQLTLQLENHKPGWARISVIDNGIGILKNDLTLVFNSGFTTKAQHPGLGLHAAGNAAIALKGSVGANSDGLEKGAEFCLDLPITTLESS